MKTIFICLYYPNLLNYFSKYYKKNKYFNSYKFLLHVVIIIRNKKIWLMPLSHWPWTTFAIQKTITKTIVTCKLNKKNP